MSQALGSGRIKDKKLVDSSKKWSANVKKKKM
jgi:hypothetical protein